MKKIFLLIFFLFTSAIQAQVLWGISVTDINQSNNWLLKSDSEGNTFRIKYNLADYDWVTSNEKGYLFFRNYPPDFMYEDVYSHLVQELGTPTYTDDYTPNSIYTDNYDTPMKVKLGKWKFYKLWETDSQIIDLSWKENKLKVECIFKEYAK